MKRPLSRFRVALAYQTVLPHLERITAGVLDFARRQGGWEFAYSPEGSLVTLESLARWNGDGVLTTIDLSRQCSLARRLKCPVVNLSGSLSDPGFPTVISDNRALGARAAEHFLQLGFSRFAYYGLRNVHYSKERQAGFEARLTQEGFSCEVLQSESSLFSDQPWQWNRRELESFLRRLKLPVALFAVHDYRARMILEICVRLKIPVPEALAVLGANDDPIACGSSSPPLSSIPQDSFKIGLTAGERLWKRMCGEALPSSIERIAPLPVVGRRSTDTSGVDEPRLRTALSLIQRNLATQLSIENVAEEAGLSRRRLEQLFTHHLHRSPHAHITWLRVRMARELIQRGDMKRREIARRCGFHDARRLNLALKSAGDD